MVNALPVSRVLLLCASFLAPQEVRAEWLAEWEAELWHVRRAGNGHAGRKQPSSREPEGKPYAAVRRRRLAIAFCLGAFPDALWLRRNGRRQAPHFIFYAGSAPRCGLGLVIVAAASMLLCCCLPGARKSLLPLPYRDAASLAIISSGGYSASQLPGVRLSDYQSWRTNGGSVFQEVAFYRPAAASVRIADRPETLTIARASQNLFALLNLPSAGSGDLHTSRLMLSYQAWQRLFPGGSDVTGRVVEIAGQPVSIAGVLPQNFWRLPGRMDGWMLEREQGLDALPPNSKGFVLARLRISPLAGGSDGWRSIIVTRSGGEIDRFTCLSLARQSRQPFSIFLFTLFLACVALPATTPLPLGDYPEHGVRLPRSIRARRWIFLAAKFALVAPTVFFCSADLAYGVSAPGSPASFYIQFASSFIGLLFAFRWTLRDQRKRCPVCLRLLSNPARVGQASRNFLAWNGTELICAKGHGLLHIPELTTSWCGAQRWLYLDASWRGLFSDGYVPAGGAI